MMQRLKDLIYDRDMSSDEKYDYLLSLMHKLDGRFELEVDGQFVYVPHQIESSLHGGVITIQHNGGREGTPLVNKITRNMLDEKVGRVICKRLNYIDDVIAKKVFYDRQILRRDVRYIKKKYKLGSTGYYSLLNDVKNILIEFMCFNISIDTICMLEKHEQQNGWYC